MHSRARAGTLAAALMMVSLMACAGVAAAQDTPTRPRILVWSFHEENDVLAGTDRHYTQGFKFSLLREQEGSPGWMENLAPLLWNRFGDEDLPFGFNGGWSIGQNMYNPAEIERVEPDPDDRPWAGWLYLGRTLQVSSDCEAGIGGAEPADGEVVACRQQQHTFELDLGVVGPLSGAKGAQTELHKLIDSDPPLGWDNQLGNEPGLLLLYTGKWRYPNRSRTLDAIPHVRVGLGNVLTFAGAGGTVRLGRNLSGFGGDLIPAVQRGTRPRWEAYLFAGAEARLVGVNIFLDGNHFRDSPSIDKEIFVYDLSGGGAVRYRSFRVAVTLVQRSPEFKPPSGRDLDPQKFGSFVLSWERGLP
ncbi:MAG: lipid A deacylase LpxR family protein [Acidobacteriota bacterium]